MKKHTIILLAFALVLSFSACSTSTTSAGSANSNDSASSEAVVQNSTESSAPVVSGIASEGNIGDHYVVIKEASMSKDYEGKNVIVVTYDWTNNSEDTTSFMVAISTKAFQNGVQCDSGTMVEEAPTEEQMKNIRPGATIEIKNSYVLSDLENPVEIEASELFSLNDEKLLKIFDLPLA